MGGVKSGGYIDKIVLLIKYAILANRFFIKNGIKAVDNYVITVDENGNKSKQQFDKLGRMDSKSVWTGTQWQMLENYTYNDISQMVSKVEHRSDTDRYTTTYTYYPDGQLQTEATKDRLNQVVAGTNYLYDYGWNYVKVTTIPYADGNITPAATSKYTDTWGRVIKEEVSDGQTTLTTTYTHDYLGNVLTVKDPKANADSSIGNTMTYTYDHANNVLTEKDARNQTITYTYDAVGRLIATADYAGNVTTQTYDTLSRLIKTEMPFDGSQTAHTKYYYDLSDNLIKTEQQSNKIGEATSYTVIDNVYDVKNRPIATITGGNSVTRYQYDPAGNVMAMYTGLVDLEIAGNYAVTTYEYDYMNRVVKSTDPLGKSETFVYDRIGNLYKKTDKNNVTTQNEYNVYGQITLSETSVSSSSPVDEQRNMSRYYSYDIAGNMRNDLDTSYTYDSFGRVQSETKDTGLAKIYGYDLVGNRISLTVKQDNTVQMSNTYTYDNLNRLTAVHNAGGSTYYDYDAMGRLYNANTVGQGFTQSINYMYNKAGMLTHLQNTSAWGVNTYNYTYYRDGNRASETTNNTDAKTYLYDDLGRLQSETNTNGTTSYLYDNYSNRIKKTSTDEITEYVYNKNSQLLTERTSGQNGYTINRYSYDPNGNQVTKSIETIAAGTATQNIEAYRLLAPENTMFTEYRYDLYNQLERVENGSDTITYSYFKSGLRSAKNVNGTVTKFVYDGANIIAETNNANAFTAKYYRGLNLISREVGGARGFYSYNGHGDVVRLDVNSGGQTSAFSYGYDAFGNQIANDPNDTNPFRYGGGYFDQETKNIYMDASYYEPSTGRMLAEVQYVTQGKKGNQATGRETLPKSEIYVPNAAAMESYRTTENTVLQLNVFPIYETNFYGSATAYSPGADNLNCYVYAAGLNPDDPIIVKGNGSARPGELANIPFDITQPYTVQELALVDIKA